MLRAPGFHAHSIAKSNLTLSLEASLAIPFKNICQENSQEKLKFSKLFQAQKAYHFFEQSFFFFFFRTVFNSTQATLWLYKYPAKN